MKLQDVGFEPEHTGGNCWALFLRTEIPAPNGENWILLATDGNFGIDFDDMAEGCFVEVGRYPGEDALGTAEGEVCAYETEHDAAVAVLDWLASLRDQRP